MTGLDADLATLRWAAPGYQDEVDRVEVELSRLREERDAAKESARIRGAQLDQWERAYGDQRDKRKAAEARCARLQQALETIERDFPGDDDNWRWVTTLCREALAGPDTPAREGK